MAGQVARMFHEGYKHRKCSSEREAADVKFMSIKVEENNVERTKVKVEETWDTALNDDSFNCTFTEFKIEDNVIKFENTEETSKLNGCAPSDGDECDQFSFRENGPAVIVELVGDATLDMLNDKSLNNLEYDERSLVETSNRSSSRKSSTESIKRRRLNKNNAVEQNALDEITKGFALSSNTVDDRKEPKKPKKKRKISCSQEEMENFAQREIKCNLCSYKSKVAWQFKRHMKIHDTQKPFGCPYCNYKSCHATAVKVHIRTHTGEKPYACGMCTYRTSQKCHLNTHTLTHSDEKPIKCKFCSYRAKHNGHLRSHMKIHLKNTSKCQVCSLKFESQLELVKHMETHN